MKSSLVLLLAPLAALAAPAPRQAADSIDELIKAKGKLYYGLFLYKDYSCDPTNILDGIFESELLFRVRLLLRIFEPID